MDQWRRGPMGLASAHQYYVMAAIRPGPQDPMVPALSDGWKEVKDDVTGSSSESKNLSATGPSLRLIRAKDLLRTPGYTWARTHLFHVQWEAHRRGNTVHPR